MFGSCQDYRDGYWTAWPHVVADNPDLVLWLGDYIYEGGVEGTVRDHNSDEVMTLVDYRNRYGLYKQDPGLQAAHAAAPWIVTWDDHEVENNYARLTPQDPADVAIFRARRAAAYQAFWEHQPIRSRPNGEWLAVYRTLRWGRLLQLLVLDGRQYRANQACNTEDLAPDCEERNEPGRTMLGPTQFAWLQRELAADRCRWSLLANQTVMTPVPFGPAYNMDQWDGYPAERTKIFKSLARVRNAVVITGDIHAAGVGDLREEPDGSPVVGTELVTAGISSSFDPALADLAEQLLNGLDQVKWFDAHHRGYVRCDVTPESWRADFRIVDDHGPTDLDREHRDLVAHRGRHPRRSRGGLTPPPPLETGALGRAMRGWASPRTERGSVGDPEAVEAVGHAGREVDAGDRAAWPRPGRRAPRGGCGRRSGRRCR